MEFTRRWALHILPKGFMKVRRYGGFSDTKRVDYLERCTQLQGADSTHEEPGEQEQNSLDDAPVERKEHSVECPHCHEVMICVLSTRRPSWSITMNSRYRPPWYLDN